MGGAKTTTNKKKGWSNVVETPEANKPAGMQFKNGDLEKALKESRKTA